MALFVTVGICLLTCTISQSKVITVTTFDEENFGVGYDCCVHGGCICGSFLNALQHLDNNTLINITSQAVSLHEFARISSLTNIAIFGNGAIVMCNNSGIVSILNCSNVVIERVTWDRCGNTNHPKYTHGIGFGNTSNITIFSNTFQYFGVCTVVLLDVASGYVVVRNSNFIYNHVVNSTRCTFCNSLLITGLEFSGNRLVFIIAGTNFHHNGVFNSIKGLNDTPSITLLFKVAEQNSVEIHLDNSTISSSGGLGAYISCEQITNTLKVLLLDTVIVNNSQGGLFCRLIANITMVDFNSSTLAYNSNGSLKLKINAWIGLIWLHKMSVFSNKGTFTKDPVFGVDDSINEGVGLFLMVKVLSSTINISFCNFNKNSGGISSIVYVKHLFIDIISPKCFIISSNFTDNIGPALRISLPTINLEGLVVYEGNSAESGAAVYIEDVTQVTIGEGSTILFINNSASLHGGAIYVDLPLTCSHHGVVFTRLPHNSDVVFINNSAGITGNSMYFSIPESCDVIRDYNDSNSIVYIPNKFSYSGLGGTQISTSPYQIKVCSPPGCDSANTNNCFIQNENMLGESINFNATVCDYFNNVAEAVQFNLECIDCNGTYRLYNSRILAHNGVSNIAILSIGRDIDINYNINFTINMFSSLSHIYKQLTATFSFELSSCQSGFVFDVGTQQCTCYGHTHIIQCREDYIEIKQGYWFGIVFGKSTVTLCPQYYCKFSGQIETRTGYIRLPANQDDQCSTHRIGPACGECSPGYSLSYDTPDCVSNERCSISMTILLAGLTMVYWIAVVAVIFVLMYFINKAPIGYAYGIIYYYSIVDILLGNNLYISDGVFQFTTILSSFTKLVPQFLGKFCFVHGLSGIDQQFIRYSHAVAVFLLVVAVIIAARYSTKVTKLVSRCIIRVICLLLLLAYTSLATTSLQLLRPLYYQDVDGAYVYLSPSNKYFSGRHIVYAIVAFFFEIFVINFFILFLLCEPCLKKKFNLVKIKPLHDQLQACYKEQYHWFAAYYLVCRQMIILIVYINNDYDTALYCLQTFCIIIVAIHVWIHPYKSTTLNMFDGVILITLVLVVNLNSFTFSRSFNVTSVVVLVIFPLLFAFIIYLKKSWHGFIVRSCFMKDERSEAEN